MDQNLHFLLFLCLIGGSSAAWYNNQTDACNYCGQWVFGVLLQDDVETLIGAFGLYTEYGFCPNQASFIPLETCTSFLDTFFSFFYRIYYAIFRPFRDYYCVPICGNSGEDFEIVFKKKK